MLLITLNILLSILFCKQSTHPSTSRLFSFPTNSISIFPHLSPAIWCPSVYVCVYIYIPGILPVPRVASLLARVPVDSWSNIPQVKRAGLYWCNTPSSCWAISPLVITALIQWTWVCFCVCACQRENSCWFDCTLSPLMLTMITSASYRGLYLDQISLSVSSSKHWHQLMTEGKIMTCMFSCSVYRLVHFHQH